MKRFSLIVLLIVLFCCACQKAEVSEEAVTVPSEPKEVVLDPEVGIIKNEFDNKIKEMSSISFDELESGVSPAPLVKKEEDKSKIKGNNNYRTINKGKNEVAPKAKEDFRGFLKIAGESLELKDIAMQIDPEEGYLKVNFYQQKLSSDDKLPGMPLPLNFALSFKFTYSPGAFCKENQMLAWQARLIVPKHGYSGDFKGKLVNKTSDLSKINIKCESQGSRRLKIWLADQGKIHSAGKILPVEWQLQAELPWPSNKSS